MGDVKCLQKAEDRQLRLLMGGEPTAGLGVRQLALQRCEHALGQRLIEAVRDWAMEAGPECFEDLRAAQLDWPQALHGLTREPRPYTLSSQGGEWAPS